MNSYRVKKYSGDGDIAVSVPGSKSITNRALLLAAMAAGPCVLKGVLFSGDTRAMLDCLGVLGIALDIDEENRRVTVSGCGGKIPHQKARINVGSAGTVARFLPVALALTGNGEYVCDASPQMRRRPMRELIAALRGLGVGVVCLEEEGFFPFAMTAPGAGAQTLRPTVAIDTDASSQFASAFLLAGAICPPGLAVELCGARTEGAYIAMSLKMLAAFGIDCRRDNMTYVIEYSPGYGLPEYEIEPDVSSACYFYALAPLLSANVLVRGIRSHSLQGDIKFLQVLEEMGCRREESADGIKICGRKVGSYPGVDVDMRDFSDQTMTLAALAPFAATATTIRNVGHIRGQESDRLMAIVTELRRLGCTCELVDNETGVMIHPLAGGDWDNDYEIETYEDHRLAMAFTLVGLKTGRIAIKNPACVGKSFAGFFETIEGLL
ncbi:MAG: 3-phosphoshikimate 1-carboxyvinyltransferase [Lachnospiraceae bacterium]|jgi:3-phosphoshikimate 1-carboxyvinyltransferase|nr:3-phosphoshikimate 1-carboxyvinyltransferase [Lachnospiraceae bacterium]